MLLEKLKDCLARKGYNYQWMDELSFCLNRTDARINNIGRHWSMKKVFGALKDQLQSEKRSMVEVKMIQGKQFIRQLLANYRTSILSQKTLFQT